MAVIPSQEAPSRGSGENVPPAHSIEQADSRVWNQSTLSQEQAQFVTDFNLRFRAHRNARLASGVEQEWKESLALYFQDEDHGVSGSWRSQAFVPHATSQVHKIVPHMVSALLEADTLVSLTPVNDEDIQYARVEEKSLIYQLTEKIDFETNWEILCKGAATLGTGVCYIGWNQAWKTIQEAGVAVDELGVLKDQYQNRDVPTDGHNTFLPLDISDIWVDVNAVSGQPLKRLFHYQRLSRRQMEGMGIFINLDNLSPTPPAIGEYLRGQLRDDDPNSVGTLRSSQSADWMGLNPMDIPHHILTEWDDTTGTFSMVADDMTLVLPPTPYPFKHAKMPFVFMHYELVPGRFYSKGLISFIAKSCREANRTRRQRSDNVELAMNKMFVTRTGAILDETEEMKWRPGGVIHTRGPVDQIVPLQVPDVTQSAYMEERIIKSDIEDVNGVTNAFSGQGDPNTQTATGTVSNRNQSQLRINGIVRHTIIAAREIFTMMVSNNRQFIPPMEKEHLVGQSAMIYGLYTPEMSKGEVVLRVNPAKLYDNSDIKNQQFINGLMMMGKMGLSQFLDQGKLANLFVTRILGVDDPRQVLSSQSIGSVTDFMKAQARAEAMVQTGQVIPPQQGDNNQVNIHVFEKLAVIHTEIAPLMEAAIQVEQQAIQQRNLMLAQLLPPGMQAEEGGGGGVNPARQPAMTSETGAVRTESNIKAGASRAYAH